MVPYHLEVWSPETTVGGNRNPASIILGRDRRYIRGRDTLEIAGGCDGCVWPRR